SLQSLIIVLRISNFRQTTVNNISQSFLCKIADSHCSNTVFCCYPVMFEFTTRQQSGSGLKKGELDMSSFTQALPRRIRVSAAVLPVVHTLPEGLRSSADAK
ncbi:hypothetical protein E2I00_017950, partial [Balaenoptera physalus]